MRVRVPPFESFLEAHREDVFRFLVAAVGPQDAEDCFQETFLAALRAYARLRNGENLKGWILTIAHRKGMDSHRARRKVRRSLDGAGAAAARWSATVEVEPGLWEAVRRLPPKQRAAVAHRYVNDLSYADIARIEGITAEAARRNVTDGLKNLREVWTT